jgi:hypothetical protein
LLGIDLAGEPRDLPAVWLEQDHGRISAHFEARSEPLRIGAVAVDVYGNEKARPLDEILTIEDGRLDLIARRAPHRAPV